MDEYVRNHGHFRLRCEAGRTERLRKIRRLVGDDHRRTQIGSETIGNIVRDIDQTAIAAESDIGQRQCMIREGFAARQRVDTKHEHQINCVESCDRQLTIGGELQARIRRIVRQRSDHDLREVGHCSGCRIECDQLPIAKLAVAGVNDATAKQLIQRRTGRKASERRMRQEAGARGAFAGRLPTVAQGRGGYANRSCFCPLVSTGSILDKNVIARPAVEDVLTRPAEQHVVADAPQERVVARATD